MRRVAVIGCSCSGKTTFARDLAEQLNCPHIELDALHWGPGWTERPDELMRSDVDQITQQQSWVACGNYAVTRDLVWGRADTLVWLNYPLRVVMRRALQRTFRRSLRREELWSGNRESLRRAFFTRDSILLWVLQTHGRHRRRTPELLAQPKFAHLQVVELRSPKEVSGLLQRVQVR